MQCGDFVSSLEVLECEFVIACQVFHFAEEVVGLVERVAAFGPKWMAAESYRAKIPRREKTSDPAVAININMMTTPHVDVVGITSPSGSVTRRC